MTKTYQEALSWASSLLKQAGIDPDGARYVLQIRAAYTPSQAVLHRNDPLPAPVWTQFQADVPRLVNHEPAQYVVGVAPFFGDMFEVTPAVLIPRFETEELVAWVTSEQATAKTGLDLGTGSGVIGLTLAKQLPQTVWLLSDVSAPALMVAKQNAARLGRHVTFKQSDLFAGLGHERFDVIVANLPYISHAEEAVMDESTLLYEPKLALFASADGLALFDRFVAEVQAHLTAQGTVYLEFGYRQQPALAALFARELPTATVTFRHDMAGHPRMVRLSWPDLEESNGNETLDQK